jgi:hypothetical protein
MSYRDRLSGQAVGPPILDDAPLTLRTGFAHIFADFRYQFWSLSPGDLLEKCERAIRHRHELYGHPEKAIDQLIIKKSDWLEFYRIVELGAELSAHQGNSNYPYRDRVNALLEDENSGWRLGRDGLLTHAVSAEFTEATAGALAATNRPELTHLRDQLTSAIDKLKQRKLDPENAVKDAVGALEGVARWRLGKTAGDLGDMARELRSAIHPALGGAIDALLKIEAFRGDMAAHAARADRAVTPEEAIFVIHQCSAAIRLLAGATGELNRLTSTSPHSGSG